VDKKQTTGGVGVIRPF